MNLGFRCWRKTTR